MIEALIVAGSLALVPMPDECSPRVKSAVAIWWFRPLELAPGASVSLEAYWTDGPRSFERAPRHCVTDVQFSPEGIVQLEPDGVSIRVADNAPGFALVTITGRVGGQSLEAQIRVVRPEEAPLRGTWRQTNSTCLNGLMPTPIQELVFDAMGRFSVTWTPFEVYRDYWGAYRFDPAVKSFGAEVESGNNRPANLDLAGTASVVGDELILEDVWLGDPAQMAAGAGRCTYRFVRAGASG
jgi:hypothetical protein